MNLIMEVWNPETKREVQKKQGPLNFNSKTTLSELCQEASQDLSLGAWVLVSGAATTSTATATASTAEGYLGRRLCRALGLNSWKHGTDHNGSSHLFLAWEGYQMLPTIYVTLNFERLAMQNQTHPTNSHPESFLVMSKSNPTSRCRTPQSLNLAASAQTDRNCFFVNTGTFIFQTFSRYQWIFF